MGSIFLERTRKYGADRPYNSKIGVRQEGSSCGGRTIKCAGTKGFLDSPGSSGKLTPGEYKILML